LDQDLVAGAARAVQAAVKTVRRLWPRFLKMRTLMVGCAAGEGHLAALSVVDDLAVALPQLARQFKAKLIVMKEFPARYRAALSRLSGFTRVPSMPMTGPDLHHSSFDEYAAKKLTKPSRKSTPRKLREGDSAPART